MKKIIIFLSIFILALSLFFIINNNMKITGKVIYYNNTEINLTNISFQIALDEIQNVEQDILEMKALNFSVKYMLDNLEQAKKNYQLAYYSSILRNEVSVNSSEKETAKSNLRLIDYRTFGYYYVTSITNDLLKRKTWAFDIYDNILITQKRIENYKNQYNLSQSINYLNNAKISFENERYEEADNFLKQASLSLEDSISQKSILLSYKNASLNFLQKYGFILLIIAVILGFIGYYGYKKISRNMLKSKIEKMKTQKEVLKELMKTEQEKRYVSNKTPELIYTIRMNKYKERLNYLKAQIPVLEARLRKLKI